LQGPNSFDGHQQNALAQRRGNEAVTPVKAYRIIVDRVNDDSANASDLRGRRTAAERIRKQIAPRPSPWKPEAMASLAIRSSGTLSGMPLRSFAVGAPPIPSWQW
jgi:hypothetical protein